MLRWNADINAMTDAGDTPAHLAAYRGHLVSLKMLILAGANLNLKNKKQNSVIEESGSNKTKLFIEHFINS